MIDNVIDFLSKDYIIDIALLFVLCWNIVLSVILYKTRKNISLIDASNKVDHKKLNKNQEVISSMMRRIEILLRNESEPIKTIKNIIYQKIIPIINKDDVVKKLTDNITALEIKNKESLETIKNLSIEVEEIKRKYRAAKEEIEFLKTTKPLEKL